MNKIKNVCLLLILSFSVVISQDLQIQWAKTYDYESGIYMNIDFAHDGGFVFTTYDDKTIVKIDKHGIVQEDWPLDIGKIPIYGYLQKCNEGYILISTVRHEGKLKALLKKLDNQGRLEWEKYYYEDDHGEVSVWNSGEFVKQTQDEGYILFCTSNNNADPSGSRLSFWFIKTDPYGEIEWESGACGDFYGSNTSIDVHQLSDGGYIFAYNNDDGGLTRLSPDGQDIWEKRYDQYIKYVLPADNGGFFIGGNYYLSDANTQGTVYLKKVDENGDEIWIKTFQNDSKALYTKNMILLDDNSCLLCGSGAEPGSYTSNGWIIKADSLGNKIWEKNFPEINNINQVLKVSENEFLVFGEKDDRVTIIKLQKNDPNDPTKLELLDPVNHKLGVGNQLCLDWTSVANASSYLVELDDDSDMSSPLISKTVSNSSSCIISDLAYSTQYYWRVRAQFPEGPGNWYGINTFTTMLPPHMEFSEQEGYYLSYVDVGDQYYTDRDYTITELPDQFKNCIWIKTLDSEKYLTDDNYIQFQLKRDATVYIAYDNRASSVPQWLSSRFEQTEYTIQNSDEESNFTVWKGQFTAGDVTLGANSASGAEGVLANYVAFIDIPLQMLDPRDNKSGVGKDLSFSWEAIGNFENYDLQISENQDMSSPLSYITNIKYTRYILRDLDYNKDYYWRIKAHNCNDENSWYQTQKFHTMDEPIVKLSEYEYYILSWLEENDQYYINQNDVILSIPDQLKGLLWVKTANNDLALEYDSFYIHPEKEVTIYVGFDSRATSLPNWVTDDFKNTGLTITVSDSANELNIWTRNLNKSIFSFGECWAEGAENIKSQYVVLIDTNQVQPLSANFGSDVTSGVFPLTVNFSDSSQGLITSWLWDFGDGATSTEKNPSHTYENSGNYSVRLTVHTPDSSDTIIKENYITVKNVIANFSADVTMGKAPLTVSFTDNSLGEIDAWLWKFGDGLTSTEQNPTHVYTSGDSFTVSLFVRGPNGSNTMVKSNYIIVDYSTSIDDMAGIPEKFALLPNYPNPFNPQTTIRFAVPKKSFVNLTVYDINGKRVNNLFSGTKNPGYFSLTWDATGFPSGMYFIKMDTDAYSSVKKCMLIK